LTMSQLKMVVFVKRGRKSQLPFLSLNHYYLDNHSSLGI
jgi:hypothetical protein